MLLLVSFIFWCAGSLCMRLQLAPGVELWWKVSLSGLFFVPYMYYLLASAYTGRKGYFMKIVFGIGTVVMVVLNFFDVFLPNPRMENVNGEAVFHYDASIWAILPVIFSLTIIISVIYEVRASLMDDVVQWKYLRPLLIGIIIMLVGVLLDVIPAMNTFPNDTLSCMINACFVYYAFCKKRIYATSQIASGGAVFVISLVFTAVFYAYLGDIMVGYIDKLFGGTVKDSMVIAAVICAFVGICFFVLFRKLSSRLFIRDNARRDENVRDFSTIVNSSLQLDEILSKFYQLAKEEVPAETIHLAMYSEADKQYVAVDDIGTLDRAVTISADNPLISKIKKTGEGIFYEDFRRSVAFRGMWEEEKRLFEAINANYILPFMNDGEVLGFAIFSGKSGKKATYSYEDINFLNSLSNVSSMAIKNARLYSQMEREARHDLLTGAFNRRALIKQMEDLLADEENSPVTFILFNLDDFSLYNELYGTEEGDRVLKAFADMLNAIVGSRGMVARYSGKEFGVLLPKCDSATAMKLAQDVRAALAESIEKSTEATKKFLTFSAGICTYPYSAANLNQLVSYANMAVFKIKQKGKNDIAIFTVNMKEAEADKGGNKDDTINELYSTIYALTAAIDAKDHYTFNHSQCVSKYAVKLAQKAGLNEEIVEVIRQAGLLHDIGKIGIPDAILSKEGKLTPEEFAVMRQHVERSIEMIRHLPSLDYVIPAVLGHHEKYDGSGYPRGIKAEYIPIGARCLSIADSFDAMVSKRSYKSKMPVETAVSEIENNAGTQFDPWLAKLFVEGIRSGEIEVIDY